MEEVSLREKIKKMSEEGLEYIKKKTEEAINDESLDENYEEKIKELYEEAFNESVDVEEILVREAKKEADEKANKSSQNSLVVISLAAVVAVALSTHIANKNILPSLADILFGKEQNIKIENEVEISPVEKDQTEEIIENSNDNDIYNIGGRFILNDDAKIYSNYEYASNPESLEAQKDADTPLNELDRPRTIASISYLMPDGTYEYAHNSEEEQNLEKAGGVAVSVGSTLNWGTYYNLVNTPDGQTLLTDDEDKRLELIEQSGVEEGYFNIDDINVEDDYKVGGR